MSIPAWEEKEQKKISGRRDVSESRKGYQRVDPVQCWIMSENPSTQDAQEPATPAILYPRGGIKVWLFEMIGLTSSVMSARGLEVVSLTQIRQWHSHRSQIFSLDW